MKENIKTIIFEQVSFSLSQFFFLRKVLCLSLSAVMVGWLCVWFGVQEKVHDVPPRHYYIWSSLSNKTLLIAQSVRTKELAKKVSLHRFSLFLPFCVCVCVSRFSFSFFFKLWKWCQKHGGGFEPRRPNNFDQTTTNATHTQKHFMQRMERWWKIAFVMKSVETKINVTNNSKRNGKNKQTSLHADSYKIITICSAPLRWELWGENGCECIEI